MSQKYIILADLALAAIVGAHLVLAPYTKVEESFNIQAVHDMLNYGVFPALVLDKFDHKTFPGVVPRTFVGSVAVAALVKVLDLLSVLVTGASFVADGKTGQLHVQMAARAVVAAANVWGFRRLRQSLAAVLPGKPAGPLFYSAMLLAQFHVVFYASRMLPNFVAMPLVNLGLAKLVSGDLRGLTWLAFVGVVFRLEVGVLASIVALVSSLVFGQSNVLQGFSMLAAGSVVGLALTYSADLYFWGSPTFPELQAFVFNVVHGKSAEWGVEPFSAYFTKYIANFFRPPHVLVLAVLGLLRDPARASGKAVAGSGATGPSPARNSLRILAVSALLFVLAMSLQPHKEWRFVIYVVPILTLLAGNGFAHLWYKPSALYAHKLLVLLVMGSTLASLFISSFMAYASSFNYPGGAAIHYVNQLVSEVPAHTQVTVHMDVPACMTGITRFTELHRANIVFDKTETEHALARIWNSVDYLISHRNMDEPHVSDLVIYDASHWIRLHLVPAFVGIDVQGVVRSVQLLVGNPKFRSQVAASAWAELKVGKFTTLAALVDRSIVLRDYLHIYKRTAPDPMPAILELDPEKEELEAEQLLMKEYEEQLANQIDPQDIRESVNEQIDDLEDAVNARHDTDEL
ncbi:hypothetical protein METBIDRAFT_34060 [Metschnikowia bicuspidata var. bicuspidata NRRL YB-4993]|uniref:Mannosyltransferase n=1 Tax=Metschnikowia bicuspidata var. bicuspidata NRRL YB-4993 TaxID=869754 RepID=A0A1A0HIM4_9ASCO|nr:hypothetical protein METBIDRAFT_34060 [Metschnikowia bicuspidata var. bicuspidata NRRL YB-4993]OBA23737.1 hypothetical protein METBIDRAFT_34060 [Metschnikowia bicuspidata var. bicuspidata NRRL YB-4993]